MILFLISHAHENYNQYFAKHEGNFLDGVVMQTIHTDLPWRSYNKNLRLWQNITILKFNNSGIGPVEHENFVHLLFCKEGLCWCLQLKILVLLHAPEAHNLASLVQQSSSSNLQSGLVILNYFHFILLLVGFVF